MMRNQSTPVPGIRPTRSASLTMASALKTRVITGLVVAVLVPAARFEAYATDASARVSATASTAAVAAKKAGVAVGSAARGTTAGGTVGVGTAGGAAAKGARGIAAVVTDLVAERRVADPSVPACGKPSGVVAVTAAAAREIAAAAVRGSGGGASAGSGQGSSAREEAVLTAASGRRNKGGGGEKALPPILMHEVDLGNGHKEKRVALMVVGQEEKMAKVIGKDDARVVGEIAKAVGSITGLSKTKVGDDGKRVVVGSQTGFWGTAFVFDLPEFQKVEMFPTLR